MNTPCYNTIALNRYLAEKDSFERVYIDVEREESAKEPTGEYIREFIENAPDSLFEYIASDLKDRDALSIGQSILVAIDNYFDEVVLTETNRRFNQRRQA